MKKDFNTRRRVREITTQLLFLIGDKPCLCVDDNIRLNKICDRLEWKRDRLVFNLTGINLKEV